jgi:hypothetical protein
MPHGTPEKTTTSGTEAGLAALAVEGAALDLFEPGTPDADPLDLPIIHDRRAISPGEEGSLTVTSG